MPVRISERDKRRKKKEQNDDKPGHPIIHQVIVVEEDVNTHHKCGYQQQERPYSSKLFDALNQDEKNSNIQSDKYQKSNSRFCLPKKHVVQDREQERECNKNDPPAAALGSLIFSAHKHTRRN